MPDRGWSEKPNRYFAKGRETIDRMRDYCYSRYRRSDLADHAFAIHCELTALKFRDRAGLKGDVEHALSAAKDIRKAEWYEAMALHSVGRGSDPREARGQGFVPYSPEVWSAAEDWFGGSNAGVLVDAVPVDVRAARSLVDDLEVRLGSIDSEMSELIGYVERLADEVVEWRHGNRASFDLARGLREALGVDDSEFPLWKDLTAEVRRVVDLWRSVETGNRKV